MLLSKTAIIKWNSKIKKHYEELGYQYTKMGNEFVVNIEDLTNGSSSKINIKCDYCGKIFCQEWRKYLNSKNNIKKDCCNNSNCTGKKSQESLQKKYNVNSIWDIPEILEKRDKTNIERFGCKNPFGNIDIQNKIKNYYLKNYGVEYNMQISEVYEKYRKTCIEKYGVDNYAKTKEFRERFSGENSPVWKGSEATTVRNGRELSIYRNWRKSVFDRDLYTCQCCFARNGNGKYIRLEAHHILDWKHNESERYVVSNGITLCSNCHILFHSIYGKNGNNEFQLNDFIKNNKTIKR